MNVVKREFQYGNVPLVLETGRIARQASGAVMVSMGDTVVLVACVASKESRPDQGFFPLTVDYQEKNVCGREDTRRFLPARGAAIRKRGAHIKAD